MEKIESKKPRLLLKILKWVFLSLFSLIILATVSGLVIINFYGDTIKAVFVRELNTQLRSEVNVRDISFTVFEHFPYATLRFSGVSAKDATDNNRKDTLLKADMLLLNFNVLDLYNKNYKIKRIDIRKGKIHLKIFRDLSDNFHFWKESTGPTNAKIDFRLEKVSLENVKVIYDNYANGQKLNVLARDLQLKGRFRDDHYSLKAIGLMTVGDFRLTEQSFAKGRDVTIDVDMAVDNTRGIYTFQKSRIELGELSFLVKGAFVYSDAEKSLDFSIISQETALKSIVTELPAEWQKYFERYEFNGNIAVTLKVKGHFMGSEAPQVKADFSLTDATIKRKGEDIALERLNIKGVYFYKQQADSARQSFDIKSFSASLKGGVIEGSGSVDGFVKPYIFARLKARFDLADLQAFLYPENIEKLSGKAELEMVFDGQMHNENSFSVEDFLSSEVAGIFKCSGAELKLKGQKTVLEGTSGSFTFNNNDVRADNMQGKISGNDFSLNGAFSNLLPYIFNKNQVLGIKADLTFATLDLASLFEESSGKSDAVMLLKFPGMVQGDLNVSVRKLQFARFKATDVTASLRYGAERLFIRSLSMNAFNGKISAGGSLDASRAKTISCYARMNFANIDISKAFDEMGNFGQQFITNENLKGLGTGNAEVSFLMADNFDINPASILASISLQLSQGELNNYKTIQGLGKFIRVDDLSHIRFSTLQNDILIKEGKITIPHMTVNSDALNFTLAGTHSFDNAMDYKFQVKLSEILWKKARTARKENEEFGIVENEGNKGGRTTLFISLTGTVDKPIFKYDIGSVRKKISSNISIEKKDLRSALQNEFGKTRAGLDSVSLQERDDIKMQESGKFLFEWEGKRMDSIKVLKKKTDKKPAAENPKFKVEWDDEGGKK